MQMQLKILELSRIVKSSAHNKQFGGLGMRVHKKPCMSVIVEDSLELDQGIYKEAIA